MIKIGVFREICKKFNERAPGIYLPLRLKWLIRYRQL